MRNSRTASTPPKALIRQEHRRMQHIGAADRVGSIECGKDADLVLMDGAWNDVASGVRAVFVNGEMAFGAAE